MADDEPRLFSSISRKKKVKAKAVGGTDGLQLEADGRNQDQHNESSAKQDHTNVGSEPAAANHEEAPLEPSEAELRSGNPPSTSAASGLTSNVPDTFKGLGLSDWLCSVCKSLGMARPTDVQRGCIPAVLGGKDVIGLAQTGSGKTAAFALPILQSLAHDPYGVYALVLTPTRELAIQISEQFRALGAGMSLKECVIIGGVEMQQQARELARRPHVLTATPGRLRGLLDADTSLAKGLARVRFLVMDEADRLLDHTFESDLRIILKALPPGSSSSKDQPQTGVVRQTLLFSATMTKALIKVQQSLLHRAYLYQAYEGLKTADRLKEQYVFMPGKVKEVYLCHLLEGLHEKYKIRSAMIFCSTCKGCNLLSLLLEELGIPCASLHSGKSQRQRLAALSSFKSEAVPLLLATDVASRGLDIPSVDLVVNFDLPVLASDYVHRVGRTARAGRAGWSLSFITQYDVELVHKIEALIGHQLEELKLEEAEVLKGITRVYSAKRAAMLRSAEDQGLDVKNKQSKKFIKKLNKQFDAAPGEGGSKPKKARRD